MIEIDTDATNVSDGFHTMAELYEHRHALFVALIQCSQDKSWRARRHDDGTMFSGMFIAGIELPAGTITYHLPLWYWGEMENLLITTYEYAPKWDGHTSADVLARLSDFKGWPEE